MTDLRDTGVAFDHIAPDIEPLLVHLGRAAPGAELDLVRDEITALLDGAGLRWSDVGARVAAPSPAKPKPGHVPPPLPPGPPVAEVLTDDERRDRFIEKHAGGITAATVLTNEELRRYGGYRTGPSDGYGYDGTPIPGADDPKATA